MDRQQPAARLFSVGLGLIVAGLLVMVAHLIFETLFQDKLLDKFGSDYHRRPMGESYTGIGVVVVGALLLAFATATMHWRERPTVNHKTPLDEATSENGNATRLS
jgi:hypothetical protein